MLDLNKDFKTHAPSVKKQLLEDKPQISKIESVNSKELGKVVDSYKILACIDDNGNPNVAIVLEDALGNPVSLLLDNESCSEIALNLIKTEALLEMIIEMKNDEE